MSHLVQPSAQMQNPPLLWCPGALPVADGLTEGPLAPLSLSRVRKTVKALATWSIVMVLSELADAIVLLPSSLCVWHICLLVACCLR